MSCPFVYIFHRPFPSFPITSMQQPISLAPVFFFTDRFLNQADFDIFLAVAFEQILMYVLLAELNSSSRVSKVLLSGGGIKNRILVVIFSG